MIERKYNRRDFLQHSSTIGAGLALANLRSAVAVTETNDNPTQKPLDGKTLRIGFVGIGARGSNLLRILLELDGVEICALCDIIEDRVTRAQRWVQEAGKAVPPGYSRGDTDFKRMCENEDLDLVITATPWQWHVLVCVAAMESGKHAATEVPAAITLDECWQLVETAEKHGKHCMMLENYCYFRKAMTILNMIRKGVFGELLHCEGRTQENWIRENWRIFNSNGTMGWAGKHLAQRNGNPYPTHGFGPMAMWANVNRGDRLDYLVSLSSKSRALKLYAEKSFGKDHTLAQQTYLQGDANITLIRTINGVSFTLYFGGQSPQPWSPEHKVQGTLGTCIGELFDYGPKSDSWIQAKVYEKDKGSRWVNYWNYAETYDHPLWKAMGQKADKYRAWDWSGAYDYLMLYQLVNALRKNRAPVMDVYDAATWSAISELTERSVANKSIIQEIPDFTKGKWKNNVPTDMAQI